MKRADLPGYLKNSKLLNNLSVQSLLQYWAIICVVAVVILSLTAVITNDVVSTKQDQLNQIAIPVKSSTRNLQHILAAFDLRRNELLAAITKNELEDFLDRENLEQRFHDQLQILSTRSTELKNTEFIIDSIKDSFQEFLNQDDNLTKRLKFILGTNDDETLEISIDDDTDLAEILALINIENQEIQSDLRRLSDIASDYIKSVAANSLDVSHINLFIAVALSLIVIAVISGGISLVLYRINDPLEKLSDAMHDLSHGDMSRRLKVNNLIHDEFSDLSANFNRFAVRTQSLFDEVTNAKNALEDSEKRTRAILENALVGIAHLKEHEILSVNQKFVELFGYDRDAIEGTRMEILYPSEDDYQALSEAAFQLMSNGDIYQGEWKMKHKNGNHFWCDVSAKSVTDDIHEEGTIWLFEDITQRKRSEEELRRLANFDTLTQLPNRTLFEDRLVQAMERARRQNSSIALIYVDLDRFKKINDSFGHSMGDELLKNVSKRLCECVRGSDTVSRWGGDEYTIILTELQTLADAGKVSEKIISIMEEPFELDNQEISISPSIGISLYPDDATDMETLLQNADAAMYHAKSTGRNNYQFYTQEMNAEARHRLDLEGRLRHAIDNEDFLIYYQPQVDVSSMNVTGYEALIRWNDGKNGLIPPLEFIPLLEDTGLIVPVGEWILRKVCSDIEQILEINSDFISVSVNFSARQFVDNKLVNRVETVLRDTGVSSNYLVVELTETILMTETERSFQVLSELSSLGLRLSLDDFGTGYSSLAYLKQFPIDVIKIDQSFVRDIHKDTSDAAICEAIIAIAQQLGLKVVAEGVETKEQFDFMQKRGCHSIQGYYFGKPSPMQELIYTVKNMH